MPGGAALVGIGDTEHPEEVARVMDYLASEEILSEFSARTLFIPAHSGVAEAGVAYETDNELAKAALDVFVAQVPRLDDTAFALQGYTFNRVMFDSIRDRLTQAIVGELTLEESFERMEADIEEGLAAAAAGE
jgi:alpha-1,4-digalacturonate transport system substrate-binding protein